jgi:hypothetical protein
MLGFDALARLPLASPSSQSLGPVTATASITEASDTLASVAVKGRAAQAAITEDDDTPASAGALLITAQAAITEEDDTSASEGGAVLIGSIIVTEDDDDLLSTALLAGLPPRLNTVRLSGYSRISSRMGSA